MSRLTLYIVTIVFILSFPNITLCKKKDLAVEAEKPLAGPPAPPIGQIDGMVEVVGKVNLPCSAETSSTIWKMVVPIYRLINEGLDGVEELCGTIFQKLDGSNIVCLEPQSIQLFNLKGVANTDVVVKGRFTHKVDQGSPITESSLVFLVDTIVPAK